MARLENANSSERAAALADLAEAGGDDSFRLITKSFDDPSVEVRNAAARALYHLNPELAASFTRALREASPERRRKIGAAIAGSGWRQMPSTVLPAKAATAPMTLFLCFS